MSIVDIGISDKYLIMPDEVTIENITCRFTDITYKYTESRTIIPFLGYPRKRRGFEDVVVDIKMSIMLIAERFTTVLSRFSHRQEGVRNASFNRISTSANGSSIGSKKEGTCDG